MNLPLSYNYCKTNKIALINEDNKSTLHICGLINPSVLSADNTDGLIKPHTVSYTHLTLPTTPYV